MESKLQIDNTNSLKKVNSTNGVTQVNTNSYIQSICKSLARIYDVFFQENLFQYSVTFIGSKHIYICGGRVKPTEIKLTPLYSLEIKSDCFRFDINNIEEVNFSEKLDPLLIQPLEVELLLYKIKIFTL